jgi:TonB family protein
MRNLTLAAVCALAVSACVSNTANKKVPSMAAPVEQTAQAQPTNSSVSYDPVSHVQPIYPGFDIIFGVQGNAVLMALVDPNGRVADIKVEKSTGARELDLAAINAVRQWRFIPERKNGVAQAGYARIPIAFSMPEPSLPNAWPMSYIHPRYVPDTQPMPYTSVDDALRSVTAARVSMEIIPSRESQTFIIRDNKGAVHEWWIFTDMDTEFATALRYTFTDAGLPAAPEIKVSALCREGIAFCDSRVSWFLRGPAFARAHQLSAEKSP